MGTIRRLTIYLAVALLSAVNSSSKRNDIARDKKCIASSRAHAGEEEAWQPSNVVDDDKPSYNSIAESCTCYKSQRSRKHDWLQIDLGSSHDLKWMRLRNRFDCCAFTVNFFKIYVSDTPMTYGTDISKGNFTECYPHPGDIPDSRPTDHPEPSPTPEKNKYIDITCINEPYVRARYVLFYREKKDNESTFTMFCQLNVYECEDGSYGKECKKNCSCFDNNEVCNKVTGSCFSGCKWGFKGTDCKKRCPPGKCPSTRPCVFTRLIAAIIGAVGGVVVTVIIVVIIIIIMKKRKKNSKCSTAHSTRDTLTNLNTGCKSQQSPTCVQSLLP